MATKISFEDFKKEFIDSDYGWGGFMPVYGYLSLEGPDGETDERFLHFRTNMVVNWRLDDGPSRFVRVYHVNINRDQVKDIQDYLLKAGETFKMEMQEMAYKPILGDKNYDEGE